MIILTFVLTNSVRVARPVRYFLQRTFVQVCVGLDYDIALQTKSNANAILKCKASSNTLC